MSNGRFTRRQVLRRAAAAVAAPTIVSSSSLGLAGAVAPSNRITLGLIGCGGHGIGWNMKQIFRYPEAQLIAVADVDAAHLRKGRKFVDDHYRQKLGKNYSACQSYTDFRDLIVRKDLDAIANCTPDHWHVIPAVMAAKCGKDVICEKPLTLTVAEGRELCDTMAKTGRIFQTASENRSIDSYIRICELVRNGRIGTLKHIRVTLPGGNESRGANFHQREIMPVPDGFDYDMWLGQAPEAPYCPARCHGSFRWFRDYSGGRLTDWGAHLIDLAQWANDSETTGPVEVEGKGRFPAKDDFFSTAYAFDLHYKYANGVTLHVKSDEACIRFEGTEGWIGFNGWRSPLEASDPRILKSEIGPEDVKLYRPTEIIGRTESKGGEYGNFLECVRTRKPCYAPAETGHRTTTISHIGNIAMLLNRPLRWDPAKERFHDDPQADALLSRKQRDPWTLGNIDRWIAERS